MNGRHAPRLPLLALLASATSIAACVPAEDLDEAADALIVASGEAYDVLITGGTVVDGSGESRFVADVAVKGDRIVAVGDALDPEQAAIVVDARGLVVSPGFIDNHAHIQSTIHEHPLAENFTRQGITTILASLHSHDQPWPLDDYAASLDVAVNVGFFAGHTWTRKRAVGLEDRAPTPDELEHMKALVDSTMLQGALGLATGLQYVPASYAETEEIIELARVAAGHGGIYTSHMRDEARGLLDSVEELIRIAREADIPAQIQHHKAIGPGQWGWSQQSLDMIDAANAEGLDIRHDLYPYTAASTHSGILFPQWVFAGGSDQAVARLDDPALRSQLETEMREIIDLDRAGDDMSRIQFRTIDSHPEYNGLRLSDMLEDRGLTNSIDDAIPLLIELQKDGGFSAIYHSMDEADLITILQHPLAMIETDGDPVSYGFGFPHPRSYGAFPRLLARYVRELGVLTLETAIRKMTRMPAEQVGQLERGLIAEGMLADITIFDPATVSDRATFVEPHQYSIGIHHVIVNGEPVILDGAFTGARPGVVIVGPARPDRVQ
jgi:N-acyl-D-aspartate/D-glutamate deacylase